MLVMFRGEKLIYNYRIGGVLVGYKMQKMSKLIIILLTIVFAVSLIGNMSVFANGYETVGGEVAPINFITIFLVPAVITIAIFGALIVLAIIRISRKPHVNETA